MTTLPLASKAASACPDRASCLGEYRGQFGAAVVGAPPQARARVVDRPGKPSGGLGRKVGAPRRDVEHRDGIVRHRVANGNAGTDPLIKARCTSVLAR